MSGVLVAVVPGLGQGLQDDSVERLGHIRRQGRRRLGDLAHMLVGDGDRGVPGEGGLAGEQLVEQAPGGVEVGTGIDDLAARLLRGEVLGGADHGVRLGDRRGGVLHGPRNAEIHDLHRAGGGQHDVPGLDVAVHDARTVGVLESIQHTRGDLNRLRDRDGLAIAEEFADRVPLDVLHHDVGHRPR